MLTLEKLLSTPTTQLGKAGRFVVFQIKLWSHCARLLKLNRSAQQAAALSYHTIFGIVPLAIVTLLLFQSFPAYSEIGDKVKNFVYEQANLSAFKSQKAAGESSEETVTLTDHLDDIVARFFGETNRGPVGLVSILLVIWAAMALLTTIERSFNNIWHVARGRSFFQRIVSYWALLTLGPLLLGAGIYLLTREPAIDRLRQTVLSNAAPLVLSYLVATGAFFLLYFVLPNTKVKVKAALWGAAIGALVWIAAKNVFGYCITELKLYYTVYGVLALIPMTVVWIYITWLTVLFGLQLTFTTQHLTTLDAAQIAATKKNEEFFIANDLTAINIVREIAAAFRDNQAPVPAETLCGNLDIPAEFGQKILDHLVSTGLIVKTSEPVAGFMPAKEPEKIRLSDIAEALASAGLAQPADGEPAGMQQVVQAERNALAQFTLQQIINAG